MTTVLSINDMNICSDLKHKAHSKAVLDDSWITVDTTSLHQHKLYYCDRSHLSHSESEQYKLLFFGHFNLSKNIKQTAVINITTQRML